MGMYWNIAIKSYNEQDIEQKKLSTKIFRSNGNQKTQRTENDIRREISDLRMGYGTEISTYYQKE